MYVISYLKGLWLIFSILLNRNRICRGFPKSPFLKTQNDASNDKWHLKQSRNEIENTKRTTRLLRPWGRGTRNYWSFFWPRWFHWTTFPIVVTLLPVALFCSYLVRGCCTIFVIFDWWWTHVSVCSSSLRPRLLRLVEEQNNCFGWAGLGPKRNYVFSVNSHWTQNDTCIWQCWWSWHRLELLVYALLKSWPTMVLTIERQDQGCTADVTRSVFLR